MKNNNNFNWNKTILSIIGLLSIYLFISYNLTQAQHNNITFAAQLFGLFKPGSTSLENLLRTDSNGNLGVNLQETDTIDAQLDINGSIKIRTGATTPGQVLTAVDNTGLASWQDATGGSGGSSLKAASFDITFDVYNDSSETITINLNDNTTTQNNATINNLTSTNDFASDQPLFVTYGITYNNLVKARLNAEATPIINLSYPDNTSNPSQPLGARVQFSLTTNPDYVGNTSYTPPYGQFKIRATVLQAGGTTTVGPPLSCASPLFDSRDGQSYNTVLIGSQCWMAENLNYGTRVNGGVNQTDNATAEKYCYDDSDANCTMYGGLYQWDEAMQYAASCNGTGEGSEACASPVQGICPSGWHIPSHYEYVALERAVCSSGSCTTDFLYDTSTSEWRGTNEGTKLKVGGSSGFEGLLAGYRYTSGSFFSRGSGAFVWSSSLEVGASAWRRYLDSSHATVLRDAAGKLFGYSVRCLKD